MNINHLSKSYAALTPLERFRLILAAGGRGDDAERDRLAKAGEQIMFTVQDFAPYFYALQELAQLTYIELLEEAHRFWDALDLDDCGDEAFDQDDLEEAGSEKDAQLNADAEVAINLHAVRPKRSIEVRNLDLVRAAGFMLHTKAEGWKLFCERLNVSPFLLWQHLPGFDRLRNTLALAERQAFSPNGLLKWLNDTRPAGKPKLNHVALTAEAVADDAEAVFRERAEWWSAERHAAAPYRRSLMHFPADRHESSSQAMLNAVAVNRVLHEMLGR